MAGIFAENCIYEQVEKYCIYINNTNTVNCFDFNLTLPARIGLSNKIL